MYLRCFPRLDQHVRGRARAGEGVGAAELSGGSGTGVDHPGPGKVTCGVNALATESSIVLLLALLNGALVSPEWSSSQCFNNLYSDTWMENAAF